jgi:hypothetical protein
MSVGKFIIAGATKVAKHMLKGVLVIMARVSSIVAEGSDGIGEIRASAQHEVHESTEGALVGLGVDLRGIKFNKVFIGYSGCGDRANIRFTEMLEDLLYILLL